MDPYHPAVYGRMMPPQPYLFDRAAMHPPLDKYQVSKYLSSSVCSTSYCELTNELPFPTHHTWSFQECKL